MQNIVLRDREHLEQIALSISKKRQRPLEETKAWLDNFEGFLTMKNLEKLCECVGYGNVFFDKENLEAIKDTKSINDCFGIDKIIIKLEEPQLLNKIKDFIPLNESVSLSTRVKIEVNSDNLYIISYYDNYQNIKDF